MSRIGDLTVRIGADTSGLNRGVARSEADLRRLDRTVERTASMARNLAGAMVAIAASAGFTQVIREVASFQQALNGLAAVTNATSEQLDQLEKQSRSLGSTSQFSAQQAAEAQRFLAQAGFEVNDVLGATPGILKLATAAQIDLGQAADIASNVLGGMRLEVGELNRVNDVLAATASRSNTTIQQLGDALSYAAPFAASAGLSIEEAAASIGVMSDAGIQASRAGTGLIGVIRQLSTVTDAGQEVLAEHGLSLEQVNIEARGLSPVLDTLRAANLSTADSIALFGSEAGAAAQVLIGSYKGAISGAEGEARRMARQLDRGLIPAFKGLQSAASEAALQLGDSGLAGALESAVRSATGVISVFNGMAEEFAAANNLTDEQTRNMQDMASAISSGADAAMALAAVYTGSLIGSMARATVASAQRAVAAQNAAVADATANAAAVRRTAAERQAAFALLSTARLEEQATRGTAAHTYALNQLSVARTRASTAATAHTAATNTAAAAMSRASIAARGLSGAMTLVGGPIGLLVGAGGLLYIFREELGLVQEKAGLTEDQIEALKDEMSEMSNAEVGTTLSELGSQLDAMTLKAASAREELANLRNENRGSGVLGFGAGEIGAEVAGMQAVAKAQERIAELNERIALGRSEVGSRVMEGFEAFGKWTGVSGGGDESGKGGESGSNGVQGGIQADRQKEELDRLREHLGQRVELLRESLMTEQELETSRYLDKAEELADARELEIIGDEEHRQMLRDLAQQHEEKMSEITAKGSDERARLQEQESRDRQQAIDSMMNNIISLTSSGSKKLFQIGKVAAIANAVMKGYEAVVSSYAWGARIGGPPLGAAMAAAAGAATFAQIQNIRSQQFSGGGSTASAGSAGSGASTSQAQQPAQPAAPSGGTLTVQGISSSSLFTGDAVRELAEELISYQKRGGQVVIQ